MTDLEHRIDAAMAREIAPDGPGAVLAIVKDGVTVFRKGYGLANIEWGTRMPADAVFPIASLTKQFTAVAIMMLKERGLVSIDAPLETYLPDFPTRGRRITVRQLLNHTSGLCRDKASPETHREISRQNLSLAKLLELIAARPLEFEPGERYAYSNSGYVLLGAIIERISGQKYRDFLKAEMFDPLGMANTFYLFDEPIVPKRVAGYQRGRRGIENASYISPTYYHASGGLASTADDLATWDAAMWAHRLIGAESFAEMLVPVRLNDGSEFPYGFGYGTAEYRGHRIYHHTGGLSGFASHMAHLRDASVTTIVLANLFLFPMDRLTRLLLRCGLDLPDAAAPQTIGTQAPDAFTGTFEIGGVRRDIVATDGGLAFADQPNTLLLQTSDDTLCEANDAENIYRFTDKCNGKYWRLEAISPLWPPALYRRVA
ncbi:MAG TPA: serine hydrolase domain-containing protein [Rhizomicrobium sp.]|nr:serine hydrolase domain-containing protein [Rhizomicrobium sp.]